MNVAVLGQTDPKRVKAQRARGGFEVKVFGPRCTVFGGPYTNASDFPDAWRVNMADEHRGDSANVFVPTRDFSLPPEKEFRRALVSTVMALYLGMDVYVGCMGCIGGHGRTGLVLSALVHVITGEKSAIHWAREHHCKKAVESESQVKFLVKHFGIESAKVTPRYSSPVGAMAIGGGYPSRGYSVGRDGVVDFDPFDDPYAPGRALDEMGVDDMFPEGELPAPRPRAKKRGASCAGKVKAMMGSRSIW
jgi:hypothetical protein